MIDFIFNLLNFSIVCISGIYIYKRYFYFNLQKSLSQYLIKLKTLKKEHAALLDEQLKTENEIAQQKDLCSKLTKKVDIWKDAVRKKHNQLEKEYEEYVGIANERISKQAYFYNVEKIHDSLIPELTRELKKDLNEYFQDYDRVYSYLDKGISNLTLEK